MDDTLIVESSVLIALERERLQRRRGPAMAFLAVHPHHRLVITPIIAGELAAGRSLSVRRRWDALLQPFRSLPMTAEVAWHYGSTYRYLQANGMMIGLNDLWIAAAGLAHDVPVVTANPRDFTRVPGLEVIALA